MAASAGLLQFLLLMFAGWLQRQQATLIEYLKAENRMLRERLGKIGFEFGKRCKPPPPGNATER